MRLGQDGKPGPSPEHSCQDAIGFVGFAVDSIPQRPPYFRVRVVAARRYLLPGAFCLVVASAVLHVPALVACNEVPETSFGNPNTLDRKNLPGEGGAEPLVCTGGEGGAATFDGGCPSFTTNIYPLFSAAGKFKCADATCHGGKSKPDINGGSPGACLASLKAIEVGARPYIPEAGADPNTATLVCNLQGGCGRRMPEPPGQDPTTEELCMIDAWLRCGAPE